MTDPTELARQLLEQHGTQDVWRAAIANALNEKLSDFEERLAQLR